MLRLYRHYPGSGLPGDPKVQILLRNFRTCINANKTTFVEFQQKSSANYPRAACSHINWVLIPLIRNTHNAPRLSALLHQVN